MCHHTRVLFPRENHSLLNWFCKGIVECAWENAANVTMWLTLVSSTCKPKGLGKRDRKRDPKGRLDCATQKRDWGTSSRKMQPKKRPKTGTHGNPRRNASLDARESRTHKNTLEYFLSETLVSTRVCLPVREAETVNLREFNSLLQQQQMQQEELKYSINNQTKWLN